MYPTRQRVVAVFICAGLLLIAGWWRRHQPMIPTASAPHTPNRLLKEQSPYLQQHAYNPVDWYPWGDEAIAKAKREHKPILLSIGYSTCHWCHVMERESFEDPATAALMNAQFVSIKVDREEHPDVDQIYMHAVIMLSGHGGWPLTVFLTPDLKPFFGGTYFPPERHMQTPSFREVLDAVASAWRAKRGEVIESADRLTARLREQLASVAPGAVTTKVLDAAREQADRAFDAVHGGFGPAPKFPRSHELSWLLHEWVRTRQARPLEMVMTTLDHLARGGIHDQLGGGFHRYATDAEWLVPHFEKMLYDQALLARTFVEAFQVTGQTWCADTARDIFDYVLRDMTDPHGGFYAAEDADSEGEEGKFYVWRPEEFVEILGRDDAEWAAALFDVTPAGNFSAHGSEALGGERGASIVHLAQPVDAFATARGWEPVELARRLASARAKLLAARARRIRPHRDDKILTSWNGLMIASLAYGGAALDEPRYVDAAQRAAEFIWRTLFRDGQLLRRYRKGDARFPGTLEDYAYFSYGLLELYEASGQARWLASARELATRMIEQFWDAEAGGWYLSRRDDSALIATSKEIDDGAMPSGNSMAALVCLKLGRLLGDASLEAYGRRTLETFAATVTQAPWSFPQLLIAWDMALGPNREIVIAGDWHDAQMQRMRRVVARHFLPRTVVAFHEPGANGEAARRLISYLGAQIPLQGKPTAYVCEGSVCQLPVTRAEQLETELLRSVDEGGRL